jgi:hypothetical protein
LGWRARISMSTPVVDVSPGSNLGLTDKPDEVTKSYIMQQTVDVQNQRPQSKPGFLLKSFGHEVWDAVT